MSDRPSTQARHNPPDEYINVPPQQYALDIINLLFNYKWVYDTPLVAFLDQKMSLKLPTDWLEHLSIDTALLPQLILSDLQSSPYSAWPLSLHQFLNSCRSLAMPREPKTENTLSSPALAELDPYLCVGMKQKKIHEVLYLSNVIHDVCGQISRIVDVGSGKGYIAQALSHHFGFHVCGLEGNESQHEKAAARFDRSEQSRIRRKDRQSDTQPVNRLHSTVNFMLDFGLQPDALDTMVQNAFSNTFSSTVTSSSPSPSSNTNTDHPSLYHHDKPRTNDPLCLMSLHACGDLSPCLLELYSNWIRSEVLVNVACCYHKMSDKHVEDKKSFPMSKMVASILDSHHVDLRPHFYWLELATHSPLQWQAMTAEQLEIRINKLAFRAMLETLLRSIFSTLPGLSSEYSTCLLHVQKMRSDAVYGRFEDYIRAAMPRCRIKKHDNDERGVYASECIPNWNDIEVMALDRADDMFQRYETERKAMAIFLALQSSLAPVAESLVLLDRWAYLEERNQDDHGAENSQSMPCLSNEQTSVSTRSNIVPWIVPVFDQAESPRNLAIIAVKRPN